MKKRLELGILALALLLPSLSFGQAKVGTAGLQFLKVGVSARGNSMGDAFTAVADDASALYYNPGGLIQLGRSESIFSLFNFPAGLRFVYLGAAVPVEELSGVVGIQLTSLSTDAMIETTPEMPLGTGRTFTASDVALGLTYCQRLTDKFSVGGTAKYLNEKLADKSAVGWSADVGTFYTTGWQDINIGMVIKNFGADMNFEDGPFPLPITFEFGASMIALQRPDYTLLVAGEFLHPNDNVEFYHLGAELTAANMFSLRLGKRVNALRRDSWDDYQKDPQKDPFVEYPILDEDGSISLDGVAFGFGVKLPEYGVNLDYSWSKLGLLGGVHRFTLGYRLDAFGL